MSLICKLPEELFCNVVLSFIDLGDVGRLDSAICNKVDRGSFITQINGPNFVLPHCNLSRGGALKMSQNVFTMWTMKRGIAVADLRVTPAIAANNSDRLIYLQRNGVHVRKVTVTGYILPSTNTTAVARDIAAHCQNVSTLNFLVSSADKTEHYNSRRLPGENLTDAALTVLGNGCQQLTTVEIVQMNVTDAGVIAVARHGALTQLNLEGSRYVTDKALQTVAKHCPLLEYLNLLACLHLSDAALIAIGKRCHHLRDLTIDETVFAHRGVRAIAAGCPLLEVLRASECFDIEPAIEAIARGCPRLRCLLLAYAHVPREAVLALAECCPLLEDVDLDGSEQIGDQEITALVRGCPALRKLNIGYTSVTIKGVRAIRDNCKNLQLITLDAERLPKNVFAAGVKVVQSTL
jgi:hypothetical protein